MNDFAEFLRKAAEETERLTARSSSGFEEEPVSLSVFVQDKAYLYNPPLSPVQYDAVRHIERIYYNGWFRQPDDIPVYVPERDTYRLLAERTEGPHKPGALHVGTHAVWREERYWSENLRMINFATLQWGKGCICKYVDVYDARTGRWLPVEQAADFTAQGVDAVNLDGSTEHLADAPALSRGTESVTAKVAGVPFRRGSGPCVRVTTATGGSVDVYVGHLFVSWQDHSLPYKDRYLRAKPIWRQAGSLQPGDRIAVLSKLDCLEPVPQDPREVELVGYWIGDGSMPLKGSAQWAFYVDARADDLRARYTELVESYPGMTAKHEVMQSGTIRIRATGYSRGRYAKAPLVEIIRRWGLYGSRAWDKRVPEQFFSLPDDQLAVFLSALWDTDGTIYFAAGGGPRVQYCTVSEGLARDIQRLLLRFGVVARLSSSIKSYVYKGAKRQGRRAWHVDIQADQYVKRLLSVLRLHGEKELRRGQALEWVCSKPQQALDGDVYWDRVVSVEEIGDQEYWDMHVPASGTYVAGGISYLSSNSGKDHIVRIASMRIAYLLMCLESPQDYYKMPSQDTIHLLNVASSSGQAQQAFFMPITRAVRRGWFKDRCTPKQNVISYAKNIESVSGHSDAESQEGLNLLLGIADEVDAFRSKKELAVRRGVNPREPSKSAESILEMMRSSGATRFPEVYKQVRISYPRYRGSTIQQLTEEAREDFKQNGIDSRHYVSGPLATWEVNPRVSGKEAFSQDYKSDPVMARSKYECKPARAVNPYFRNVALLDTCFDERAQMPVQVEYRVETVGGSPVWIPEYQFAPDFFPVRGAQYACHGDLAVAGDRAGIAMAHIARWSEHPTTAEDEDGAVWQIMESRPHVKVDFVISYTSDISAQPAREIQIRWARQLCFELIRRGFNIRRFTFDGFQSYDSMQILRTKGIESERISTDMSEDPWRTLRDLISEQRVTIPRPAAGVGTPPRFLLREELMSLTRLPNGRINHPSDGSKDEADALACAVLGAMSLGGQEEESGERSYFTGAEFATGTVVGLPLGGSPRKLWETSMPPPLLP